MTILTIDDEENIRNGLADNFELEGYEVKQAASGEEGLKIVSEGNIDLVITDLRMDGISGEQVVRQVTTKYPGIPVIVLTGHGSIDDATEAMKSGAFDFLTKPLDLDHLNIIVKNALRGKQLAEQNKILKEKLLQSNSNDLMIGKSAELAKVRIVIQKAAPTKANVLITGESGVGKELVANAIHKKSSRAEKPFVIVHCAALSESLLESELFGFEKGAFTGAESMHKGRFELADGGTIFLDEIGEIPVALQAKLLRVLQEKEIRRIGSATVIPVDVRVIAATNVNIQEQIAQGRFRSDLLYRLNALEIYIPPLRERPDDVIPLMEGQLRIIAAELGKKVPQLTAEAKEILRGYAWPGNVRELRNICERLVVLNDAADVTAETLNELHVFFGGAVPSSAAPSVPAPQSVPLVLPVAKKKKDIARELGVSRTTLWRMSKRQEASDQNSQK